MTNCLLIIFMIGSCVTFGGFPSKKKKNRKAAGLDEIPPEIWKIREFHDILLRHCNAVYNQNTIDRWTKGCILPFPKKGNFGLAKNYWGITFTSTAAKIYNALLRYCIEPKIEKILRKNQNDFWRNKSMMSQISTIRHSWKCMCKKPRGNNIICRLCQNLWLHTQRKDGANTTHLRSIQRNCCSHNDAI